MNKIFKVIWSKSKQCYIVVSEIAKNKTGKKKIVVASILAALAMAGSMQSVEATIPEGTATGTDAFAIGPQSNVNGAFGFAIGNNAKFNSGTLGFAIGVNSEAKSNQSIAIGYLSKATGRNNGGGGDPALAVGAGANATAGGATAIGMVANASNTFATAIGKSAAASGDSSIAIGQNTTATQEKAIAIGDGSQATDLGTTALGRSSAATGASATALGSLAVANSTSATAVGMQSKATQADTVAIGSSATAAALNSIALGKGASITAPTTGTTLGGQDSIAMGTGASAKQHSSVSVGLGASSDGVRSIAIGPKASATDEDTIAIGSGGVNADKNNQATGANGDSYNSTVAGLSVTNLYYGAKSVDKQSIAIGYTANAKESGIAFGNNAVSDGGGGTAMGKSVLSRNGGVVVGQSSYATGKNSVAYGNTARASGETSTAVGYSTTAEGQNAVAVGYSNTASNKDSVAIGNTNQSTNQGSVTVGYGNNATNDNAVAIGRSTNASGLLSTAIGNGATSQGTYDVAIGSDVTANGSNSVAIGRNAKTSNTSSLAIGVYGTKGTSATGNYSIAMGRDVTASAESAIAIGKDAVSNKKNAVALGSGSDTSSAATAQSSATIAGKSYSWSKGVLSGADLAGMQVSVGKSGAERQIKNVAAGEVSANSTDAINGSQLYAVASGLAKDLKVPYISINSTAAGTGSNVDNDGAKGSNSIAIGPSSTVTNQEGIAIGNGAQSLSDYSIVIGRNAKAETKTGASLTTSSRAIAIGAYSRVASDVTQGVAIGSGSKADEGAVVTGDQSIAIGGNVKVDGHAAIAIGGDDALKAANQQVSYTNTNDTEVTGTLRNAILDLTGYDLSKYKGTTAGHAGVAYGTSALAGNAGVAIGTAANSMTRMNDKGQVVNDKPVTNAVAIGTGARANFDNSVAIGGGSNTDHYATKQVNAVIDGVEVKWSGGENISPGDVVSFGAKGFERQLKNVAPGEVSQTSTDAVNGSQIYSLARKVTNIMNGGSGSVVNVNSLGQPLSKVVTTENGNKVEKYYRTSDIREDGTVPTGTSEQTPTSLALVNVSEPNANLRTTKPRILGNVANGVNDNDAVNVSQLKAATVKYFSVNSTVGDNRNNDKATGTNAIAVGPAAQAAGNNTVSVGYAAGYQADGKNNVGIGTDAGRKLSGDNNISIGSSSGNNSVDNNPNKRTTYTNNSVMLGNEAKVIDSSAQNSIDNVVVIGNRATSSGTSSVVLGTSASGTDKNTIAIGNSSKATSISAVALGNTANATGLNAMALGLNTNASDENSVAIGNTANASAKNTLAMGTNTKALSEAAIALGTNAESSGFGSIAIGEKSKAQPTTATSPAGSVAIGYRTESTGDFAVALGSGNGSYKGASANGVGTVAVGTATVTASGRNFQTVVGFGATTNNVDAAAFGHEAKAYSEKSLALGSGSSATVTGGVALGSGSVANTDKNKKGFDQITGRTDTYAGLKDEAFTSTAGAVSVGDVANKVTRQIIGVAAGTNDTDAVNVAQLKSVNLAFTGNTGNGGDVNLSQSKLAVNGDNQYITTKADGKTLTISGKKQEITVSNGVASASSGMADASNVAQAITQAVSDAKYNWKLSANGQSSTETIAKGDTVDFSGDNNNITVSRTGKNISTKLNETITVDSVNAKKKVTVGTGANQIALDGTLGVATVGASGPNQIIMNGSSGIIQGNKFIGNSFKAGSSLIDNDGLTITNGPSVLATGINAGNKQITGVSSGGTIDTNAANIGDVKKAVANVSQNLNISDGTNNSSVALKNQTLTVTGTGAAKATVSGQTITIDVAKGTLTANADGTATGTAGVADASDVASAINNTNTVLGGKIAKNTQDIATNKANITANKNQITTNTTNIATNTANIAHTIALADDNSTSTTAKSLKDGNVSFNIKGDNKFISTAASSNDVTLTVNEQAIKDAAKSASSFKVKANTHAEEEVKGGDTITFNNGDNIEISQTGKTFTIRTAKNITVDSVTAGNTIINTSGLTNGTTAITGTGVTTDKVTVGGLSIDKTAGINAGGKVISNVASGTVNGNATDDSNAANIGDVKQAVASLSQNLNITDGTNNGTVDLKNQKLNVAGANGVTATVNNQTITVGLDADTVNATTKGLGLTGDTGSTGNKYLKDGDVSFAVTGDGNLVSTTATTAGVKVAVDAAKVKDLAVAAVTVSKDTQADNPITVTPTAGTNSKDYAIGIDTTKLATKTDLTYRANSAADANAKKISLSKGLNFVDGGSTVATVDNDGKVSFDLNTATKNQINTNTTDIATNKGKIATNTTNIAANTTALARNISLGADTGTTSSQSLSTADVAFNVKGATGDFVSTNMNGNTVEISTKRATINSNATTGEASVTGNDGLATAQNVADAINKAADAAKAGAAWNITTNSSTTDKTAVKGGDTVDLVNGDNIEITQDGTDKKKITVATKKDITVDSVTANNKVTVGSGANKITLDGTDGSVTGKAFTGTTFTGTSFTGTSFTAGNTVINTNGLTNGTTAITGTGVTTDNVTVGGISIDKTTGINAGNKVISNVASGGTTATNAANIGDVQNAVANLSQNLNITDGTHDGTVDLKNQKLNVAGANGVTATVNNQTITVGLDADTVNATTKGIGLTADTGSTGNKYLKDGDVSFAVTGDGSLVSTSATAAGVKIAVNSASITAGTDGTITAPTTDGVATAKNVADAINAAKKASKTEITANTGEVANATTGNVTLTSTTAADGHTIYDVKLNDKVTLGTGANAVTIDGTTGAITGKTATIGGVTVNGTANTIGGLSNTTWNGTAVSGRAATEDQLKAVADAAGSQTWEITADKDAATSGAQTGTKKNAKVGKDDKVQLIAGENLTVNQNERDFTYSLNKDLVKMNSATFEATGGKTTVIKGDSIVQTDGTNVNTSNATSNTITDGTNTSTITAGKAQIGTVGIDGVASKISTGGTNAVVVNGADGTIKTGNVTVTGGTTNDITGLSNTTLTATDFATKGRAATEEQLKAATGATTLKFTGDVATNTGSVNLKDDTFGIKGDGKYISTDVNGKNVNLTVSEAEVKKSAVAAVTVSTDTTDANNPLTVTPTTSADGTTKDYKVTIDGTKIANKTNLSYKANDGTAKQVSLADGLNFKNGTLTTASIDDNGVVKYDVNTASITAGTDGTITGPTTDGVATAKNVADAINAAKKASKTEITANTGEATNATTGNVTLTSTTAADGHTIYDVKLNDKVTLGTGANAVTIDGTTGAITGKTATIGGVTVNGTANTIGGLSNTTWNGTATTGRAATEDQLKAVADAASSQTWNITADKAGTTGNQTGTKKNATVGKDETVELVAGDNLTINQNERKFTYSLNKDLAGLTSVSIGTGTTETIKLDGATGKITAKNAVIGGVTVDGDNNHVTGLANTTWNGTATTGRAATEDQLKAVAETAKTTTDAVNLKFSGNTNTSPGVVNLKDDTLGIVGDGKYVSTDANGKNLTVKVSEAEVKKSAVAAVTVSTDTTDANNPISVTPTTSADGTTKDYKVTIDGTKIANKTNLSYKANGGTVKQVSLADGLNFKNGTLTTASIDDAGVVKYDVNTASITAGADGTITGPTTDGVATAKNVADAINAAKKASKTEITANTGEAANATTGNVTLTSTTAADGHTIYDVKLNDKVTLGSGANAVTIDGTAGKATIGSSVINGVNNTFTTGGAKAVTLDGATGTITGTTANIGGVTVNGTANTIGGLSNTTWNGTATTGRAATEDQLKAVADAAGSQTWEITADKKAGTSGAQTGTKENAKVGKDDKVSLIAGENLTVDQAGKNFTYSLNTDLVKMNSATFLGTGTNTTVITGDSITQTAGTQTNTSTAAGNTVTNGTKSTETTADGQVIKDGTKINTSTVDENTIVDGARSNKTTVDSNVIDDGNGNVNISNATSNTITDGTNTSTITAGKATIGSSVIDGVNNTFTTGGANAVKLDGAAGTIKTGTVTVTGGTTNDITGLSNTTLSATDFATKGRAATEEQLKAATGATTLKFTGDVATNTGSVNLKDDTFGIKGDGKYISTDVNGKNVNLTVSEAEVKKSAVAAVTVSTDTTDANNPLTVTPTTSADGSTKDYKVTIDGTKIANKTNLSYKANDGTAKQVSLADGLNFKNGTLTTASIDDNGVVKYDVNTASITAGTDGTITGPTTDGVATAKNVADAINAAKKASKTEITANTGEATNATTGNVTLTSTTAADGHTIYDVKLNDKVTLGSGANAVTIDGTAGKATIGSSVINGVNNTFTTGGAKAVTLDGATGTITGTTANIGGVTVNGTANTIGGLSNTTWNGTATTGRAATEDQLKAVADAAGSQTWEITADKKAGTSGAQTGTKENAKVGKDDKVSLIAGENLTVDQAGKNFTYSLNKDLLKMNSATFEVTGGKTTVIKGDSIVQTDGNQTNTATASGNTVANGTKSTETTADGQVIKDGAKSNKSTVDNNVIDDGNGNVNTSNATSNTITDGTNTSTITAGKAQIGTVGIDGVASKITTGGANAVKLDGVAGTIKTGTVTVTGGTTNDITGLSNTTLSATDFATKGRAATEEQLKAATGATTLKFTGDVATNTGSVNLKDDTFGIKGDGKYISTDVNGKNVNLTVSEAEVKKSAVAAVTVSTDTTDANNPLTVTPTTSADGTTKDYKVTIDGTKIANKTNLSYKANGGTAKQVSLADGLNFKNGTLTTASIDDAGVVKYDVNTASITAGADGTITGPTTDGVATAKNVADAINAAKKASKTEITANTGEAANATTGNVTLTSTTAADGHTIYDVKLNDKVTLGSGANAVTIDGTAGKATIGSSIVDGVNNTFTTGGASSVTLNGATGTITGKTANIGGVTVDGTNNHVMGLANKDWTPGVTQAVSGRAATEDQLQKVSDAVGAGWKVNTGKVTGSTGESNGAASTKVASGEEVQFQAGNNLIVDQNGKTVAYSLNKALKDLESATFNGTGTNKTVITGDSITQTAGTQTNTSTAGGNTVADGTKSTETTAAGQVIKDGAKSNKSTVDNNVIDDGNGNVNTSNATSNTVTDGTNTTATTSSSVTVKDNAGNSTVITKDNVTTGVGANKVTLDGTAGKATIGSSVIDGVNNTFTTGGANAVKLDGAAGTIKTGTVTVTGGTTNDITGLSNTTVTAADFATKGRAATEEQLKAVGEQTWQITADKDATTSGAQTGTKKNAKVGKDDKVQLIAGENLTVNQNERDFTYSLNKDLVKMNSATFEATGGRTTVIKGDSIVQTDGTKVNTSTAGGSTVADGTKSTETTADGQVIKDGAKSNKSTVDSNVIDDGNGNVNTSNATSNTITDGTNTSTVTAGKAQIGTVGIDGVASKITTGGANAVVINGADGTVKTGTVTVTGGTTNDITGLSNTTVTTADFATKGRAATEEQLKAVGEQTWQITADKDATTSGVQTGTKKDAKVGKDDKVQLIAGENLTVNQNERDFTYSLNKDLVKMNSATFEATGGKTTVIKGDSIVQTDGRKVNTSTAAGNTVVDGAKSTATTADGTTVTTANGNTNYAADGVRINTTGKTPVSLTDAGLDNGNNVIKNVASGHVNNDATDNTNAANIADVKKATTTVTANAGEAANATTGNVTLTSTTAADGHTIYDVKLNDKVTLGSGANAVTIDGTAGKATIGSSVMDGVNNIFTTGGANAVKLDGVAGTIKTGTVTVTGGTTNDITGLSNTTVTAADFATKGRAATEEQLKAVGEQTWQITADKDATTSGAQTGTKKNAKVGKDDKVQLIAGENLTVNQNERDFTYSLNKDLVKMNSATFEATGGRTTVIKGDSIVQTDGTKVNTSTAGGNTVADGTKSTETTAAGQVIKDGAKSNKSTVDNNVIDDGNGNVNTSNATSNTITDGTNTSAITAGKATIGSSVIDGVNNTFTTGGANAVKLDGAAGTIKTGTVTVTGGTTNDITGLSNTTVNSADFATKGRAATEEQLKAVGEQTWQITADKDTATSGAQTGTKKDAKVGKDDKVQLIAGENMTVNQNERDFTFTLNKDLVKMNSATFLGTGTNKTVITGDSITQTAGTQTNTSTAGGNTVADGTKSTETTADGQVIKDGTKTNTSTVDENTIVDGTKSNKSTVDGNTITDGTNTTATTSSSVTVKDNAGNSTAITKDNVTTGVGGNKIILDGTAGKATIGSSIVDGVNNTFTTGGANAVKLDGAAGTIKTGTVTVTGGTTNNITGLSNTTVTAADFATKGRAATEEQLKAVGEQTWQITADKDATTSGAQTGTKKDAKVGKDDKVQLIAGENMTVNQNERDFTFTLNKDLVKMNSATFLGTGSNTTVITGNSITQTAGTQTNTSTAGGNTVADGTKSTETTADGQVIKDGTKTNTSTVDENTIVDGTKSNKSTVDGNTITDGTNTTETTSSSVTVKDNAGNSTVITKDNITTGVGANKVTIDGTAGKATIGSSVIDGVNNTFTTGGTNAVKLDGAAGTIKTGTVTVTGGTTNDITGLSNTTVTGADFATKGRAATEEQLKAVGEQTWQITADKDATTSGAQTGTKKDAKVGKDDKVQLIAGENMTVNQNERDFTFTLNKDLVKMNSATFLGTGTNKTVITGDSITQTAGTQTNTSTAGGNTVADGTKSTETTADGQVIKDGAKSNKSTVDNNVIDDGNGNVNTSNATSNTITDGTNTTATTSSSVTVKDNAGNSTVITKDNITTGVGGNKITLDGTAGKATVGASVVDGINNTFTTGGANAVKLDGVAGTIKTGTVTVTGGTTNDITGLANTTVNSADFATKGRAATEEQLKAVGEQTWQITADKDDTTSGAQTGTKKDAKVGKDDKVQLIAGENMTVNQNERDFTFTLNKDLVKMNSATFLGTGSNTTVITGNSITQTAGTQTNTSTAAGNTIANGTKSTETTADGQVIKDGAKSNKSTVDSNVIDDGNGNVNTSNATSNTITDGTNTSTITAGKANIGNIAIDGVNNKITMGNGATPVTLDGANGHLDGLTNTTWIPGVTKATTGRAATEDQLQQVSDAVGAGWKVNTGTVAGSSGVSNGAASTKVSSGEEVKLQAGDNLVIDQNGKTVSYSLNKDLTKMNSATFEATGGKTTVIKGDSIVQTDGGKTNTSNAAGNTVVDGNKSTATTAAGTTITDGAKTNTSTADKNVINDGAGNTNVSNATSNTLKNAAGDETKADAKGVTVKDAAGNNATFTKDGVTITKTGKDTVSLTSNGLDNGNNKIVNVAAGVANTDAVNVGQLKEYAAKSTTELTANNGETAGSTKGNIVLTKTTAADGHTIYDNKLNDKITLGTDPTKAVTVDGTTGTVTGLTNKTWTPGSIVSGRAATEDQLKEAVADSGWKAAVDKEGSGQSTVVGTSPEKIKAEETVTFKAGNNMMVTQTGKSISYAVNPELTDMKSATFKAAAGNTTVTNGNGITITPGSANPTNPHAGPVSLTKDGLNNGNNQIKGVAPGTDPTDAVNVSQLNASNANTSQAINQIAGEVQHVGAHAAAMAALKPIQYDPLEPTQVMAGVGNYRGETAAALGLAHYTNENTMFNVGVSVGGNHNMVNAGVTHKFGYSPEKKNIPDRYKAGPISSVYVMQDEVSSLKKENAEQKYVIADQAARLTTLEAENEQQRRELAETKKGLDDLKAAVDKLLASKG